MYFFRTPRVIQRIFSNYTWGFSSPNIFITFDDGPHPEITPFVLEQLRKHNQRATFFCVGENAKAYPDLIHQIINEGHAIGNHTQKHENGIKTTTENYLKSIQQCKETLPQSNLFRPPYGRLKPKQTNEIKKEYKIIMWSWLAYDFDPSIKIESILISAKKIRGGDILVLHDNPKFKHRVEELLPKLLELLDKKKLNSQIISF